MKTPIEMVVEGLTLYNTPDIPTFKGNENEMGALLKGCIDAVIQENTTRNLIEALYKIGSKI